MNFNIIICFILGLFFISCNAQTQTKTEIPAVKSGIDINIVYNFDYFTEQELYEKCNINNFTERIRCIRDFSYKIYKYKYTHHYLSETPMSFEELKTSGGDCTDWSLWYKKIFDRMNLVSGIAVIEMNPVTNSFNGENIITTTHTYNWVRTKDGSNQYCVYVNQIIPVCGYYANDLDFSYKIINITDVDKLNGLIYNPDMMVIK